MTQEEQYLKAFEEHSDALFRHCYFRVSDRERALELVQDTFVKAWDYIGKGGEIEYYKSFLFRTLTNLIIDEYRKKKSVSLDAMLDEEMSAESIFPELSEGGLEELAFTLDAKQVAGMLEQMPPHYKEAVIMRYIDGLSPKEIAEVLGESENVVSVRVHRGIAWLKNNIQL